MVQALLYPTLLCSKEFYEEIHNKLCDDYYLYRELELDKIQECCDNTIRDFLSSLNGSDSFKGATKRIHQILVDTIDNQYTEFNSNPFNEFLLYLDYIGVILIEYNEDDGMSITEANTKKLHNYQKEKMYRGLEDYLNEMTDNDPDFIDITCNGKLIVYFIDTYICVKDKPMVRYYVKI